MNKKIHRIHYRGIVIFFLLLYLPLSVQLFDHQKYYLPYFDLFYYYNIKVDTNIFKYVSIQQEYNLLIYHLGSFAEKTNRAYKKLA